jgi:adenosine deaminase
VKSAAPARAFLADCHLHFEGCLPVAEIARLARRSGHAFADPARFAAARAAVRDTASFLELFVEACRLLRSPEDFHAAASAVAASLGEDGVAYAEVYVSPEICTRFGLDARRCLEAVEAGFREAPAGSARCRILLDVVRHWGPESADRVLDLYEKSPLPGVVGFGLGGDEQAGPAPLFSAAYLRARRLGLHTSVHAGEWSGPESVREALDTLRPDRIDHGIAAARDPGLLRRLAEEGTILCIAPSSNLRTGAVAEAASHPLRALLEAGVKVTLAADDPVLFETSSVGEYRFARERLGIDGESLRRMAADGWRAAFAPADEQERGIRGLEGWSP